MTYLDDEIITLNSYKTFYYIAHNHYIEAEKLCEEGDEITIRDENDNAAIDAICEMNNTIERAAMVTIIFSAITLEAFINDYGINHFSKNHFDDHLDKLRTVSKWIVIPQLVVGKTLNKDGRGYELLKKIFKLRDRLIHSKTRKIKIADTIPEEQWLSRMDASEAIQAVKIVLQELSQLDNTVDLQWMREVETTSQ